MMRRAANTVAALAALGGLIPFQADAQNAAKVEILYEGKRQVAICNATSAVVLDSDFSDPPLREPKPTADIERLAIKPSSDPTRQKAKIHHGRLGCQDDYVWSIGAGGGHTHLSIFQWPLQADAPTYLGVVADVAVVGPELVFVPPYPTETVQERRRRIPASVFLLLPNYDYYPTSAIRIGTSDSGRPLLLATGLAPYSKIHRIAIIEGGQDPVRVHEPTLKIEGVFERPQAAQLSTLGSRPLLQFNYRDPEQPTRSYIVGAAVCAEPRSVEAPTVDCSPLFQLRLPFGETYPSNLLASELDRPPMLSLPQGGARAFVAVAGPGRTCIRVFPLNGPTIASATDDCPLEVTGRVLGMAATSDNHLLVVTKEDGPTPVFRLLSIGGLQPP